MIEVQNLHKSFRINKKKSKGTSMLESDPRDKGRWFHTLQGVNFKCNRGQILGLLGPNGAGKTTALRILSTALKPSTGKILIDGEDLSRFPNEIRKKIGFLSGTTGLYPRLTAREFVTYFGKLHGLSNQKIAARMDELFHKLDMHKFADIRSDKLSSGMKQKVNIARTLIHSPTILVLDEPTTGLDLMSSKRILQLMQESRDEQHTVVFSTHHIHEIELLCDSIAMINNGKSCFNGTLAQFKLQFGSENLDEAFCACVGGAA